MSFSLILVGITNIWSSMEEHWSAKSDGLRLIFWAGLRKVFLCHTLKLNVLLLYFKRWYQVSHVISWDIRRADISSDRPLANLGHLDGHNTWNTWYLEKLNKSYDLKSLTVDVYDKYPELLLWQSALFQPMTARVISEIYYL